MKKLFVYLILLLSINSVYAEYQYNPYTNKLDFYWGDETLLAKYLSLSVPNQTVTQVPNFSAGLTSPTIIGGTTTTSALNLKTTTAAGTTGADMHFLVGNNGATEAMTILNSGNVGIGTTSPSQLLTVGNNNQFTVSSTGVASMAGNLTLATIGTNINIGGSSLILSGTASPYNGVVGAYHDLIFQSNNGTEGMRMLSTGNVGIGTTGPTEKLSVFGDLVQSDSTPHHLQWDSDSSQGYETHTDFGDANWPGWTLWKMNGTLGSEVITTSTPLAWIRSTDNGLRVRDSVNNSIMALYPTATFTVASSTSRGKEHADYTCDGTNDEAEIQSALDLAYTIKGSVFLREGTFNISTSVVPRNGVSMGGCGQGATILKGTSSLGNTAVILSLNSSATPLTDVSISNLEIDGSSMSTTGYSTGRKGIDGHFFLRCHWDNIYVHNTPATGIGTDSMVDSTITRCIAAYCGTTGQILGSNGIGIGIGGLNADTQSQEPFLISDCITHHNANEGIMVEQQTTTRSYYASIDHCHSYSNGSNGFAINGGGKVRISNSDSFLNTKNGIYALTYNTVSAQELLISNNFIANNTLEGIYVQEYTATSTKINDNEITGNRYGIQVENGVGLITGNLVYLNTLSGINISTTSNLTEVQIEDNVIYNNSTAGASQGHGVRVNLTGATTIDELNIKHNRIFDNRTPKLQAYGVAISGTGIATNVNIENNDLKGNLTGTVSISGGTNADSVTQFNNKGETTHEFDGTSAQTITMQRHTTANTAGNNLTITSGSATTAATDKNGGDLYLTSGTATGTGSSNIYFQSAIAGVTGTTDRSPSTLMSLVNGQLGIGLTPAAGDYLSILQNYAGIMSLNVKNSNTETTSESRIKMTSENGNSVLNFSTPATTNSQGTIFGLARASSAYIFTSGTTARAMGIGPYGAASLVLGTNNTAALTINSSQNESHVGKIISYENIACVSKGVPVEYATVDRTSVGNATTATTFYTPAASGMFRISIILQITQAATTSSILGGTTGVVITYTEPDGSVAQSITPLLTNQAGAVITPATGNTGNSTTTQSQGSAVIYAKAGTAIQYANGYASVGGPDFLLYSIHLKCEAM